MREAQRRSSISFLGEPVNFSMQNGHDTLTLKWPVAKRGRLNETQTRKQKGNVMARYVSLLRFTAQGVRNLKQSPARASAFRRAAEKAGVKVEALFWTAGAYDGIMILNGTNEAKVLNVVAKLAALGNVSTQSMRAFDAKEFAAIAGK